MTTQIFNMSHRVKHWGKNKQREGISSDAEYTSVLLFSVDIRSHGTKNLKGIKI